MEISTKDVMATALTPGAYAPLILSADEAHALLYSRTPEKTTIRKYLPSDQLLIQGLTGEHELLPVDSEALRNGTESRLTFMVRKLPRHLAAEHVKELFLAIAPIAKALDLLYVPVYNGKNGQNRGYCFVIFKTRTSAALFVDLLALKNVPDELTSCEIVFAHVQGKDNMIQKLAENKKCNAIPYEFP
jgi:RNA recognition motif. (a.k.a. RRM, RBD, or RNP domain)